MHHMKKKLIDTSYRLIYERGYCGCSISDVINRINITKGALYYHFNSKHDLVKQAIVHYWEKEFLQDIEISKQMNLSVKVRIIRILELRIKPYYDKENFYDIKHGFPIYNFISDMSGNDNEISLYLKEAYHSWVNLFGELLAEGKESKNINEEIDIDNTALFILSSFGGCFTLGKVNSDIRGLEDSFEILKNYIMNL